LRRGRFGWFGRLNRDETSYRVSRRVDHSTVDLPVWFDETIDAATTTVGFAHVGGEMRALT
jgi:hypothetical protein